MVPLACPLLCSAYRRVGDLASVVVRSPDIGDGIQLYRDYTRSTGHRATAYKEEITDGCPDVNLVSCDS